MPLYWKICLHSKKEASIAYKLTGKFKIAFYICQFDDCLSLVRFRMRQKSKESSVLQNIDSLIDTNPFLPILPRHLADHVLQHCRTVLVEGQFLVLGLAVHLELILTKEGKVFVVKDVHGQANPPDIGGFAGVAITTGELMLRPSEAWSSSREIRDIIGQVISNRCKIYNLYLISKIAGLPTEHVIHLDISIGDPIVMQVLDSLTDLQKHNTSDISNTAGPIFLGDIVDYLRVSVVSEVEFVPIHDLSEVAQFIDADDAIVTVHDLVALCDVLVFESFEDVEFVVKDIQAVGELSVCCEESMLFEADYRAQLQSELALW